MAMYSATDGVPNDFHLVHLGARAMGGAALVFPEMTCVSPDARITPGCLGLWNDEQTLAFKRIVDFVHQQTPAKIGIQLGHAGRKGATKLAWEGIDQPLNEGAWPLISASALPYLKHSDTPREMTRADMDRVVADFVQATGRARDLGFDILELHVAHGYLLSSFLSPLTNLRTDDYGGDHASRARFPLEVFHAIRKAWPEDRPMSVRLSTHDWHEGGNTPDDAAIFARLFKEAGADMIDCSSGQVVKEENRFTAGCSRHHFPTRSATRSRFQPSPSERFPKPTTPIPSLRPAVPTSAQLRVRIWPTRPSSCTRRRRSAMTGNPGQSNTTPPVRNM